MSNKTKTELKCPFCQQQLYQVYNRHRDTVIYNCANCYFQGDGIIWEYLINTKKKLDIAVDALKYLNSEGKRTRILGLISITDNAFDQIKEQQCL